MGLDRILVFQTAFLGDAILAIPLLKVLRHQYPKAKLGFVCRKGVGDFFLKAHIVDQCIEVDKDNSESLSLAFKGSKAFNADLIISPHQSFRTAFWIWRLGSKCSVGFKNPWSFFAYNKRVRRPNSQHDVIRQLSLLEGLGVNIQTLPPHLLTTKIDLESSPSFSEIKKAIAIAPGSQWATKRWIPSHFLELAKKYEGLGYKIILVGAKAEKEICEQLAKDLRNCINICGATSVVELAQVLKQCDLLVCNDSGAMHVATAVGTAVVGIFGPTVPFQGYAPWSDKSKVVEAELPCRPCGAHGHDKCPIGTHDCMKKILPQKVYDVSQGLLK